MQENDVAGSILLVTVICVVVGLIFFAVGYNSWQSKERACNALIKQITQAQR